MKILVTGAAGFIGYHVSKMLLERGDEVIGFDSINDYYEVSLKYGRLSELGISRTDTESIQAQSSIFPFFSVPSPSIIPNHARLNGTIRNFRGELTLPIQFSNAE